MGDRHRLVLEMAASKPGSARTKARRVLFMDCQHRQDRFEASLREAYVRGWISTEDDTAVLTASGHARQARYGK